MLGQNMRNLFKLLNKYLMVPMFRLGLGILMNNPVTGYIMVMKTTGRKTKLIRYTPVNYAIYDGCIYCLAGFKGSSDWLLNIRLNSNVEVILSNRAISGRAAEVNDPILHTKIARQVLKNGGFAGFFGGFNPWKAADEVLREKMEGTPVICIQPTGISSGPFDPGEWGWVTSAAIWTAFVILLLWLITR